MQNYIKVKENKLYLDNRVQISPLGREYRLSAIKTNLQVAPKYIDKEYRHHWYYIFKYDNDEFFCFEFDYYDKFLQKFNHEQTLKWL